MMKTIIIIIILIIPMIVPNKSFGQRRYHSSATVFIGYKEQKPVFFQTKEWSSYILVNGSKNKIKTYQSKIFPQFVSDEIEVLYSFSEKKYIIEFESLTIDIEDDYEGIVVDTEEKIIYATLKRDHPSHPLEIVKMDLQLQNPVMTGINGYVNRIIGEYLYFYLEEYPTEGITPYNVYRINKATMNNAELVFKSQRLVLDFQISPDGTYIYGHSPMENPKIINIEKLTHQEIHKPIYDPSDQPPFFSFDNKRLIFYDSISMEMKSVEVEI